MGEGTDDIVTAWLPGGIFNGRLEKTVWPPVMINSLIITYYSALGEKYGLWSDLTRARPSLWSAVQISFMTIFNSI